MKARKFVLIYFKTVKATQGKKKNTARYKVNKERRKSRLQNKPGKFIGSRLRKLF